jgi:hypothetical protein
MGCMSQQRHLAQPPLLVQEPSLHPCTAHDEAAEPGAAKGSERQATPGCRLWTIQKQRAAGDWTTQAAGAKRSFLRQPAAGASKAGTSCRWCLAAPLVGMGCPKAGAWLDQPTADHSCQQQTKHRHPCWSHGLLGDGYMPFFSTSHTAATPRFHLHSRPAAPAAAAAGSPLHTPHTAGRPQTYDADCGPI